MLAFLPTLCALAFVTFLIGLVTVRVSIWLSHSLGILDVPDARKVHRGPIPYLGGLGMLLAVLLGVVPTMWFLPQLSLGEAATVRTIIIGAVMIFCVGFCDDLRPMRAGVKLMLQMGVGLFMWLNGVAIAQVNFGEGALTSLGGILSALITVGWYVALMNSINLVDGLDGLAGGICFIGGVSLLGVGAMIGYTPDVLLGSSIAALVAGTTLAYLVYNWYPARTFMGDGGSLLLGFLLATGSLVGSTKTPTVLAMSVPLIALGLPLFESVFSFLRRLLRGQHPFKPDRRHLHHRLLDVGLDQRRVVVVLLFLTALLGLNAVLLAQAEQKILFLNVLFLVAGMGILIENLKYLELRREQERTSSAQNLP